MTTQLIESQPTTTVFEHPRFVDGPPENKETLERFIDGLCELQATNPEIVGATLFGSRLKGESTAKSDVDCTILIDADNLANNCVSIEINDTGQSVWGKDYQLKRDFRTHIGNVLAEKTDKDPLVIQAGIFIEPIGEDLIKTRISKYMDYLDRLDESAIALDAWTKYLVAWVPGSVLSDMPRQPEFMAVGSAITALFHPELTPGLDKYRKVVVDMLSQAGDHGETAWKAILQGVDFGERHRDLEDPESYPINLEQAREWYGGES